jgi:tyrosyl-tRNA synthetase
MTIKIELAHRMVTELHSKALADAAQKDFGARFQSGDLQHAKMPVFETKTSRWNPVNLLVESQQAVSKSEARRLIAQKAVEMNGKVVENTSINIENNAILKIV